MFPQEVEVWYIIPAIRKQLALEMISQGMSQKKVAELLNITSAAVSQYKSDKRASTELFNVMIKREIKISASNITKNKTSVFHEVMRINSLVKSQGLLCSLHKKLFNADKGCEQTCEQHYNIRGVDNARV